MGCRTPRAAERLRHPPSLESSLYGGLTPRLPGPRCPRAAWSPLRAPDPAASRTGRSRVLTLFRPGRAPTRALHSLLWGLRPQWAGSGLLASGQGTTVRILAPHRGRGARAAQFPGQLLCQFPEGRPAGRLSLPAAAHEGMDGARAALGGLHAVPLLHGLGHLLQRLWAEDTTAWLGSGPQLSDPQGAQSLPPGPTHHLGVWSPAV